MRLKGNVALVTGASRGIGRAIALRLASEGAAVAVNYRREREKAEEVVALIVRAQGRALAFQADVSVPEAVGSLVGSVEKSLGAIDICVNNAAIAPPRLVEELDLETFDATIANNLRSAFLVSSAVIPGMRARRRGRLIFLSSIAAKTGGLIGPHYAASKAGMLGLMHSYASLLASEGITSNAVAPALIYTEMLSTHPRAKPDLIPLKRWGTAEEVADVVLELASNGFITGQTFHINGGMYQT
jgi:3-oxoacyl-[acyl-carrier protein] reductase